MQTIQQLLENARQSEENGDNKTALALYQQALQQYPSELNLQIVCGNLCVAVGKFEEAAGYFRRILAFSKNADARNALCYSLQSLGNEAQSNGHFRLAEASFAEALQHHPNNAALWFNLGNAQRELGQSKNALASFQRAIQLDPNDAEAYNNLGNIQRELGQLNLAIASYENALKLKSDLHHALVHLVHQKQHICDWRDLNTQIATIRGWLKTNPEAQISPFAFLSMPDTTPSEQKLYASRYVQQQFSHYRDLRKQLDFQFATHKKTRLGYLSADFRLHPLAFLITELIENHDKAHFKTYAYSYGIDDNTNTRKRLEKAFDQFRDIRDMSDIEAAKQIHADEIDILIDLTGFTQSSRTGIVALKPAPISVNWLGYPGTMGAFASELEKGQAEEPLFDWLLADKTIAPNVADFSERLLHLQCYQPNNARVVGMETLKSAHGLGEYFVFCCFNQTFKITPDVFAVWMKLLRQVPDSVLWLLECNPWAKANLLQEAAKAGIASNRLIFAPRVSIEAHLERQRHADLFLDTLPYNAHTTASDALYMGLPILTCIGETFPARVAASLLNAMGVPELICHDLTSYEEKALYLAQNAHELASIRSKILAQKTNSGVFDAQKFARELESLLLSAKLVIQ